MADWIEWAGGECPVPPHTVVEARVNVWTETITAEAKHWYLGARDWWQAHDEPLARIVAYREG